MQDSCKSLIRFLVRTKLESYKNGYLQAGYQRRPGSQIGNPACESIACIISIFVRTKLE